GISAANSLKGPQKIAGSTWHPRPAGAQPVAAIKTTKPSQCFIRGLTPDLSRAAKRRRLEGIVRHVSPHTCQRILSFQVPAQHGWRSDPLTPCEQGHDLHMTEEELPI